MIKINLRDYYPDFYTTNCSIEVPDEVAALMDSYEHAEAAYYLRRYRHKAYYSLDRGDGIENDIMFVSLSPCEIYERRITAEQLHAAISALPDKQAKRIYAHYFLGMSKAEIARTEHVNRSQITRSINKALRNMEVFLKSRA
ncbi:MAG: sigma factor-like helix-turn-helix DNA-binding protein [Oscillospiraceae bacterium]|nr:sigma factor-like helix-turn-helix DNA-binding protein [Oscillospiraceae bacterium]